MQHPSSPFPFDAVLFDCDGVLVDSELLTNRVLAQMLSELGWTLSPEESLHIFVGKAVRDEADLIRRMTGFTLTDEWMLSFQTRRNELLERELVEIPGAPAAVRALYAELRGRIACASGADKRKMELQLRKIGLHDAFEGRMFSGHDMPRTKPHPDVYLAAAAALGVSPKRCAVVEDTSTGARAGLAAGATVFGYAPLGVQSKEAQALRAVGVRHVFTNMVALPDTLRTHETQ